MNAFARVASQAKTGPTPLSITNEQAVTLLVDDIHQLSERLSAGWLGGSVGLDVLDQLGSSLRTLDRLVLCKAELNCTDRSPRLALLADRASLL